MVAWLDWRFLFGLGCLLAGLSGLALHSFAAAPADRALAADGVATQGHVVELYQAAYVVGADRNARNKRARIAFRTGNGETRTIVVEVGNRYFKRTEIGAPVRVAYMPNDPWTYKADTGPNPGAAPVNVAALFFGGLAAIGLVWGAFAWPFPWPRRAALRRTREPWFTVLDSRTA